MTLKAPVTRTDRLIAKIAHQLIVWRKSILILTVLLSSLLGASALRTHLDAGFNKLIPMSHPYMQAFLQHAGSFSGANRVMVCVKW
jgi:predicted RND superfamily exporter protein